mmetsp:Transcript_70242/g.205991  ORF Transcript_70242/g.205991 Transcript_70242/m.205991 type:complete len:340 (-) Transcript_70242:519-1538(-)
MSTGSLLSASSRRMSTSTLSTRSSRFINRSLHSVVLSMCSEAHLMWWSRSTDRWCRSTDMAGPRSLEQPRKNMSVLISPVSFSSRRVKSRSRSPSGMSSIFMRWRTIGFVSAMWSSSRLRSPLPSVSASLKICSRDDMTFASSFRFSFPSFSSFALALARVLSTTTPTMVFRRASTAMHMNGMKMITSQLYLRISGPMSMSDHLSRVMTWNRVYSDLGTVPQYSSFVQSEAPKLNSLECTPLPTTMVMRMAKTHMTSSSISETQPTAFVVPPISPRMSQSSRKVGELMRFTNLPRCRMRKAVKNFRPESLTPTRLRNMSKMRHCTRQKSKQLKASKPAV